MDERGTYVQSKLAHPGTFNDELLIGRDKRERGIEGTLFNRVYASYERYESFS